MLKIFAAGLAIAILLSGCALSDRDRMTVAGAGVGAGVGALIGSAAAGPPGGWIGAGVGGAAGGMIAYLVRPDGCYIRNHRGEVWQVSCDPQIAGAVGCYVGNEITGLRPVRCPYGRLPDWRGRVKRTQLTADE